MLFYNLSNYSNKNYSADSMKPLTTDSCIRQQVDVKKLQMLRDRLLSKSDLEPLADLFAMVGNPTRLKMLYLMAVGEELCVCDLADVMGMSVSAVSHQLRKLRDRKLILQRREGPTIYYRLAPGPFHDLLLDLFSLDD